jgi:apolipoprotein D and lipocalin family protein
VITVAMKERQLNASRIKWAGWLTLLLSMTSLADEPLPVVPKVDLQKYAGQWYEIARLPNRFERECVRDITATYKVLPGNRIEVINQCIKADESKVTAQGLARSSDGSTSRLEVRFAPAWLGLFPFVWGDYWVIALDPDYQWSLVGAPSRDYLWILARQPVLDPGQAQRLIEQAQNLGFATDTLVFPPQSTASQR